MASQATMMLALEVFAQHGVPPQVHEMTIGVATAACEEQQAGEARCRVTDPRMCARCQILFWDPFWELKREKFRLRGVNKRVTARFEIENQLG